MPSEMITSQYCAYGGGTIAGKMVKLTPKGLDVSVLHLRISNRKCSGVGCVSAVKSPLSSEYVRVFSIPIRQHLRPQTLILLFQPIACLPGQWDAQSTSLESIAFPEPFVMLEMDELELGWLGKDPSGFSIPWEISDPVIVSAPSLSLGHMDRQRNSFDFIQSPRLMLSSDHLTTVSKEVSKAADHVAELAPPAPTLEHSQSNDALDDLEEGEIQQDESPNSQKLKRKRHRKRPKKILASQEESPKKTRREIEESQRIARQQQVHANRELKMLSKKASKPCQFWELGTCTLGDQCLYSHQGPGFDARSRQLCRFARSGSCMMV